VRRIGEVDDQIADRVVPRPAVEVMATEGEDAARRRAVMG
jgi:hypothetical protein